LIGRFAIESFAKFKRRPPYMSDLLRDMNRQTNGLGLIRECPLNQLLDPPRDISREMCSLCWLKALHATHEPDVAFADKVEKRQAKTFIIPRDLNHQAQVGFDHLLPRLFIAVLDTFSKRDFFVGRKQFHLTDLAQIQLKHIPTW